MDPSPQLPENQIYYAEFQKESQANTLRIIIFRP
jgi:hypothetical protein